MSAEAQKAGTGSAAGAAPATPAPTPPARRRWARAAAEVALVLALFFAIRAWNGRALAERPPPGALVTLGGDRVVPSAPGAPLVVHFFASWCGVCQAEEGNVAALARDHRVVLVASQSGGEAVVRGYLDEHGLGGIPVVLDARGDLAAAWGIHAFPATFYLTEHGDIATAEVGYTTELGMRARALWAR